MSNNLTVEAPDFDYIKQEAGVHTMDAIRALWYVANDEAKSRRTGVRLATERIEVKTIIASPGASQNNYDTTFATILRFDGAGAINVTGIRARNEGAIVIVLVLGAGTVTLMNNSGSSEATNRMLFHSGADKAVATNKAWMLTYENVRWRELSWV